MLICRLSPPPAPAGLLRSRAPLSLARHLPTLWGVTLPEGAFKLKLIAKAATPQAASRPAPLEGEPLRADDEHRPLRNGRCCAPAGLGIPLSARPGRRRLAAKAMAAIRQSRPARAVQCPTGALIAARPRNTAPYK